MNNSIIKMSGGLGNQLFQFALKRSIEYSTGSSTKLDLAWYRYSAKEYKRDAEILRFLGSKSDFIDSTNFLVSVSGLLKSGRFRYVYKKFIEAGLLNSSRKQNLEVKYENELNRISDFVNSYSIGSFIGVQFWSDYSDAILAEIRQSLSRLDSRVQTFSPSTIVIHARRGDYYSDPKTRNFHGYCGLDHFAEGVSVINDSYHWDSALIHSDSPEFARELQAFLMSEYSKPASIATDGDPLNILLDFLSANLFVGSNSTLSWWGNALGRHQSSVFPKSWFANENMNGYSKDYFLKEVLFTNCSLLVQGD